MKISNNCICASACFFIHIAGVDRQGTLLGIHRPYVSPEVTKKRGLNDTFSDYKKIKKLVTAYLDEMGVSQTYFERMQRVSSSEMLLLQMTEVEQNFTGKIPELEEWKLLNVAHSPQRIRYGFKIIGEKCSGAYSHLTRKLSSIISVLSVASTSIAPLTSA